MNQPDNLGDFFRENKELLKVYVETKSEIFRLQAIRIFSKSMGLLAWMVIAAFIAFLILIFAGMCLGFWLSELTQSYVKGFGLTSIILIVLFIFIAVFREKLFVNPIIRSIILRAREEVKINKSDNDED
ncbi:hypothetical protein [Pseudoflavitalea rhizosphaerae]|uniref:hypothetical protein n=1 Tax=Pseudoflavitalea rhizosphaerae TaxID=1884793 RepID=UPI000F8D73FD|nr:hypothetical protein [Pseudoflavitalea rhizosphaerae]